MWEITDNKFFSWLIIKYNINHKPSRVELLNYILRLRIIAVYTAAVNWLFIQKFYVLSFNDTFTIKHSIIYALMVDRFNCQLNRQSNGYYFINDLSHPKPIKRPPKPLERLDGVYLDLRLLWGQTCLRSIKVSDNSGKWKIKPKNFLPPFFCSEGNLSPWIGIDSTLSFWAMKFIINWTWKNRDLL